MVWSTLFLRQRSISTDARRLMAGVRPELEVIGGEHVPLRGACLVTCNHYSRPGFQAWWIALAVSAAVADLRALGADAEVHWVMTAAWTFPSSPWRRRLVTPLTRWAFRRVARVYGFVSMPPMPPAPHEVEDRARAVLQTVRLARSLARGGGMIGLAPEGQDWDSGLGQTPDGVGRFIALLVNAGFPVLPVGVSEWRGKLRVSFGPPFHPTIPQDRDGRDVAVSHQVMDAIGKQLPFGGGAREG